MSPRELFLTRFQPKFQLQLQIIDLNNVPLVSGSSFVKWDLPHGAAAEHRGRTSKCSIRDHAVVYDYTKTVPIRLTVDKSNTLEGAYANFEVIQEYSSGARGERISLGTVRLNLAEYVDASDGEGDDGVVRRYLMRESKINSTLKIGIRMQLIEGDHNFTAPVLKTAPVFGGIAGIMAGEQADAEDIGHIPSLSSKSREAGEAQDLYRRNLAAFIHAQPGELRADECIEDIFAGGDGWGRAQEQTERTPAPQNLSWRKRSGYDDHIQDTISSSANASMHVYSSIRSSLPQESHRVESHSRSPRRSSSSGSARQSTHGRKSSLQALTPLHPDPTLGHHSPNPSAPGHGAHRTDEGPSHSLGGRTSLEQNAHDIRSDIEGRGHHGLDVRAREGYEVDELDIRDDLRSWSLVGY